MPIQTKYAKAEQNAIERNQEKQDNGDSCHRVAFGFSAKLCEYQRLAQGFQNKVGARQQKTVDAQQHEATALTRANSCEFRKKLLDCGHWVQRTCFYALNCFKF